MWSLVENNHFGFLCIGVLFTKLLILFFAAEFPEMPEIQNLEKDSQTAKKANAIAHVYFFAVEMVLLDQSLLIQTEINYRSVFVMTLYI